MKEKSGHKAKKSLGQNFLVSGRVIGRIVDALTRGETLPVFEIGPGLGALTIPLAETGVLLTAFEIDRGLAELIRARCEKYDNVEIVTADIREIDFDNEALTRGWDRYLVVGNIPYLLTSTIMLKLPEGQKCAASVIMIQKEVGDRILATPGERNCGILSVFMQAYLDISRVTTARAGSFRPRPEIDSVVLKFKPRALDGVPEDRKDFLGFIKMGFSQRRKKLSSLIRNSYGEGGRDFAGSLAEATGLDLGRRPEQLALGDWFVLYRGYKELQGSR